jgi:hypothetical protein
MVVRSVVMGIKAGIAKVEGGVEGVTVMVTTIVVGVSNWVTTIVDRMVESIVWVVGGRVVVADSTTVDVATGESVVPPSIATTEYVAVLLSSWRSIPGLGKKGRACVEAANDSTARSLGIWDNRIVIEQVVRWEDSYAHGGRMDHCRDGVRTDTGKMQEDGTCVMCNMEKEADHGKEKNNRS